MDKDKIQELAVKAIVGGVIGIGGSALLKLGTKVCADAVNELVNEVRDKVAQA